ncbi:MAG: Hint domain-containing protein [Deltaproteobacteria bacterium]|nr:Hint domain-containing protein [Deltaproteobacteria bacterium]
MRARTRLLGGAATVVALGVTIGCGPTTSCFVRGTQVRTPRGNVSIEELEVGDEVLSLRVDDGAVVVRRVTHLLRATAQSVREIVIDDIVITTTDEHPFWDAERRIWTRAADLVPGTTLVRIDATGGTRPAVVTSNARVECPHEGTPVFNLTVEGPEHTYFAADIAVHNKTMACADCMPPTPDASAPTPTQEVSFEVVDLSPDVRLARAVLTDKGVSLPTSLAKAGAPRRSTVASPASFTPTGTVTIMEDDGRTSSIPAAIVTVDARSPVLVIGTGKAVIDRTGVITTDSDLAIVSIGTERDCLERMPESKPALRWKAPSSAAVGRAIVALDVRDDNPCIATTLEGGIAFEVCGIPKAAWPFIVGDSITVPADGSTSSRLRIDGTTLAGPTTVVVERVAVANPRRTRAADLDLELEELAACSSADAACGTLRSLLSVKVLADGASTMFLAPDPVGPANDRRWLVASYGALVARDTCVVNDVGPISARATLEIVRVTHTP